jgi:conjugal transfer pilus assembly protein TraV
MKKIFEKIPLFFGLLLSSCAMYQQEFDCPIPPGVSCTSVTDLESMIIETDRGADVLLMPNHCCEKKSKCHESKSKSCACKKKAVATNHTHEEPKVWVCQQLIGETCQRQGHYLQGVK